MFLTSTKKITGRDHRSVTGHRLLIKSLWFIIAATSKEVSEKITSVMLRTVPKHTKRSGNFCSMNLWQIMSLSNNKVDF